MLKARLLSRKSRFDDTEEEIEENSHSQGTKDNPATTCRELCLIQPHLRDGHYYVDPNHGCPFDALHVFCNFTACGLTCVSPVRSKFEYTDLDVVQLRFLRLHSTSATQSITLTCSKKHSPTAKHQDTTKRMLRLWGDSNEEIHPSHVLISQHGCEVRSNL
ncbi:collagen alpha-2(XI) chain-like [Sinocyclocheilus grahami]|uniref:collagen alpha-2(XI) chain-like n=1 Tax=Sinocyclocheilus grahami TaxID=75366 RepID=UPI0007AD4F85|nr:PREDICTED: collagen alpha-2(XI) chain-like [Sinocyclocheilus grahami]